MRRIKHYLKMKDLSFNELSKNDLVKIIRASKDNDKYILLNKINDYSLYEIVIQELQSELDDEIIITNYLEKFDNNNPHFDFYFSKILQRTNNNSIKFKYLSQITNDFYILDIVNSIDDNNIKIKSLDLFSTLYSKSQVLDTINDDNVLLKYYKTCDEIFGYYVILSLNNDYLKESFIDNFDIPEQVNLIKSIKSDKIKEKYILLEKYVEYRADLIMSISDVEIIKRLFLIQKNNIRISIINKTKNEVLKKELVLMLEDKLSKEILITNIKEKKEEIVNNIKLYNIDFDVDPNITIGVELEAIGFFIEKILATSNILDDWVIKKDGSIIDGLEIASPVLHFDENSLKQLYFICNFMNKKKFYTNYKCGGHIHIGFEYIEKIKELKTLLNIYGNVENILYIISNKVGTKCRTEINRYAIPTNNFLADISITSFNEKNITSLKDYSEVIKNKQETRYYGLNLTNVNSYYKNTIEFRMPNGEIDFNELINNIRLFSKLVEKSKVIANTNNVDLINNYNKLLEENTPESEKLEILLDILFDYNYEKEVYRKRYNENKSDVVKQKTFTIK